MADFNKPATTDTYANVLAYINAKFSDLALALDPATSTPTNLPTNAVRWNSANNRFEKYNGTAWAALSSTFAFTDLSASGTVTLSGGTANGVGYLNASKQFVTGSALTFDGTNFATTGTITSGGSYNFNTTSGRDILWGTGSYTYITGNPGTGVMAFGIANTEGMRLTSTGLGIGTSSPAYRLTAVKATGGDVAQFTNAAANNKSAYIYTDNQYVALSTGTGTLGVSLLMDSTNSKMNFQINNSILATLDSSGNLGLGVTPSGWWSSLVAQDIGTSGSLFAYKSGNADLFYISANQYYDGTGYKYKGTGYATQYSQANGAHNWFTAPFGTAGNAVSSSQIMTLTASGRLAVGTTSPTQIVEASKSQNADTVIQVTNVNTGGSATAQFFASNGTNVTQFFHTGTSYGAGGVLDSSQGGVYNQTAAGIALVAANASGILRFAAGGNTERARIDSAGNFGIGTSSPSQKLTVLGNGQFSTASGNNFVVVTSGSATSLQIATDGTANYLYGTGAVPLIFSTNGSERMRIASDGIITAGAGNLMSIQASSVATTSGTTADFTGIPSWVKKIKLIINEVKVSGTGNILVQIGNASLGIQTSGYTSQYNAFNNSPGGVAVTNGVQITGNSASTYSWNGIVEIINVSGNSWVVNGTAMTTIAAVTTLFSGSITMTAVLDRVRVTVTSGGFTAGSVNIIYE